MLKLTLEIVPFGFEDLTRVIGKVTIENVGGTSELGNYSVRCGTKMVYIENFPREDGAWKLVALALSKLENLCYSA